MRTAEHGRTRTLRGLTRATALLLAAGTTSCGERRLADRAVGQYEFVEAQFTIAGPNSVPVDTALVAGQGKTFGNLILHPDGKLTAASSLSGMNAYMTGTWQVENNELRLRLDSVGSFPIAASPIVAQLSQRLLTFTIATTPPTLKRAYVVAMRSDLRTLVDAQDAYFADSARYAGRLEQLGFKSSPGVNAPKLTAANRGFSAIVTHSRLPDVRCAIAKSVRNPVDSTARNGESACDLPTERDSLSISYVWRRS